MTTQEPTRQRRILGVPLVPCRAAINLVGARAGERVLVDPDDPRTALHIEKGYLVIDGDPITADEIVAESGDGAGGEGDADEGLGAGAAVGDDAGAEIETVGDGVAESSLPSA